MNPQPRVDDVHLDLPLVPTPVIQFTSPRQEPARYPGTRPSWSYCLTGSSILPIVADPVDPSIVRVIPEAGAAVPLPQYVQSVTGIPLSQRFAVVAVGSNGCPARLLDHDKFGGKSNLAIPVLRGWLPGAVSVYVSRIGVYRSMPATIMGLSGTRSRLWLTLLTQAEFALMDQSEGRSYRYQLLFIPNVRFETEQGLLFENLYAYYEPYGLLDHTGAAIQLACFESEGSTLRRFTQPEVLSYVASLIQPSQTRLMRTKYLRANYSAALPKPVGAETLEPLQQPNAFTRLMVR